MSDRTPRPLTLEERVRWLERRLVLLQKRVDLLEVEKKLEAKENGWTSHFVNAANRIMKGKGDQ